MSEKVQYRAFQRNTLLEEIQCILHEYPDNEQIIKELLQNAEDAGARSVKMGLCPSCRSDHLPDPYKKYMSGPAFCFYNDSVFEEDDWEGITMVRKSNKHDDPLKVGKFGIGFKSVFHITDTVMVISGKTILFIDPLYEEIDPKKSAEKALKALLYQMDADEVVQTHSLNVLTRNIIDPELAGLAIHLEGITGSYFRMRYPDAVQCGYGMKVPSEIYTQSQAEEVMEYARRILDHVKAKISNQ
ncbi:sacsin-like isoform X2 [Crassostrea virginica]